MQLLDKACLLDNSLFLSDNVLFSKYDDQDGLFLGRGGHRWKLFATNPKIEGFFDKQRWGQCNGRNANVEWIRCVTGEKVGTIVVEGRQTLTGRTKDVL